MATRYGAEWSSVEDNREGDGNWMQSGILSIVLRHLKISDVTQSVDELFMMSSESDDSDAKFGNLVLGVLHTKRKKEWECFSL